MRKFISKHVTGIVYGGIIAILLTVVFLWFNDTLTSNNERLPEQHEAYQNTTGRFDPNDYNIETKSYVSGAKYFVLDESIIIGVFGEIPDVDIPIIGANGERVVVELSPHMQLRYSGAATNGDTFQDAKPYRNGDILASVQVTNRALGGGKYITISVYTSGESLGYSNAFKLLTKRMDETIEKSEQKDYDSIVAFKQKSLYDYKVYDINSLDLDNICLYYQTDDLRLMQSAIGGKLKYLVRDMETRRQQATTDILPSSEEIIEKIPILGDLVNIVDEYKDPKDPTFSDDAIEAKDSPLNDPALHGNADIGGGPNRESITR